MSLMMIVVVVLFLECFVNLLLVDLVVDVDFFFLDLLFKDFVVGTFFVDVEVDDAVATANDFVSTFSSVAFALLVVDTTSAVFCMDVDSDVVDDDSGGGIMVVGFAAVVL